MVEKRNAPRNEAEVGIAQIHQPRQSPQTVEDFVVIALEKGGLKGVVQILRDYHGYKEVKSAVMELTTRDPVDRFTHAQRHALEIYAKQHGLTPANLMVEIVGRQVGREERVDAKGAERYKLRKAREFLENDEDAYTGARALASRWEDNRPKDRDPTDYMKEVYRKLPPR
jgi:hypothetical protein